MLGATRRAFAFYLGNPIFLDSVKFCSFCRKISKPLGTTDDSDSTVKFRGDSLCESAIIANLPPGNYTAIVRGVNNTTGVALVEVYDLD